ncbi:MAG: hypothetical protein JO110_05815 [Acetobacteraceae bacterium]|nr:hypothetical protein [Acetobacteraceae bacterium]
MSDKIGSPQQAGLCVGFRVIPIVRHWETSQRYRSRNSFAIDQRMRSETLQHHGLGSKDVIGRKICVGSTSGEGYDVPYGVNNLLFSIVLSTYTSQIANIMR